MEKRRRNIFLLISYGGPLISFILMFFGYQKEVNLSAFGGMFMYLPAMGVMLGVLKTEKNRLIPKRFFIGFTIISLMMIIIACGSVFFPMDFWTMAMMTVSMIGSVIAGILLLTEKKEKRLAYGA